MSTQESVELTATQASTLIRRTLVEADQALQAGQMEASFDSYVRAIGLALQLGPGPAEESILSVLKATDHLARRQDSRGLCTLGPALVSLVDQVHSAGALPQTPIMETWAALVSQLGTFIGQVGLAMSIPPQRRGEMLGKALTQATLLDDATEDRFSLAAWLDGIPSL